MDKHIFASSKTFHIFAIENYRNELRLTKICILKLCYSINTFTRATILQFVYILLRKQVELSEILSVKSARIVYFEGLTNMYSSGAMFSF